ncbi:zinc ribbon domain-containing protein [Nostoc sp. LPT]|uniref:zinc ribbon domain-containing protein n=1 Tax=Nostoc sp. LPT TaxID=2815387 RepID=UPI0025E1FE8E|nr:zinc ribbon domain-containing protein [Nostoc sp. LPT]
MIFNSFTYGYSPRHPTPVLSKAKTAPARSLCKTKKETLNLAQRVFECEHCKFVINRDLNAAINLSHCGLGL